MSKRLVLLFGLNTPTECEFIERLPDGNIQPVFTLPQAALVLAVWNCEATEISPPGRFNTETGAFTFQAYNSMREFDNAPDENGLYRIGKTSADGSPWLWEDVTEDPSHVAHLPESLRRPNDDEAEAYTVCGADACTVLGEALAQYTGSGDFSGALLSRREKQQIAHDMLDGLTEHVNALLAAEAP